MAEGVREWLSALEEYRVEAEGYRELDDERVLVLVHRSGRGKTSGVELGRMRSKGAGVYYVRGGKVTRIVACSDRERALGDLGLNPRLAHHDPDPRGVRSKRYVGGERRLTMGFLFRGRVRAAALVLVVVGFAGGIAYASIPDSSGVIHGCYKKASPKRGTLRVIDRKKGQKCSSAEYALDWNQTGRRGPTGPTGPSDVHTNYGASTLVQRADTATVASVTLPVGSYSLSANITVIAGSDPGQANCSFVSAGALRQNAAVAAVESYGTNAWAQTMSIVGDVTVTSNSTSVFLRCTPTGAALTFRGGLIATKVGTITPSV